MQAKTWMAGTLVLASMSGVAAGQTVIERFNDVYLDAIRNEAPGALSANGGPGPIARAGAMMHVAMYNAVNAVDRTHRPYGQFSFPGAEGASREVAAAVAGHRVITQLYAHNATDIAAGYALLEVLNSVPDGAAKLDGLALGLAAGQHIIDLRATDGWDNLESYESGSEPGDWVLTQPGSPVHPHWGAVEPWGMTSGTQFRPDRLANYGTMSNFLASQEYADNLNDVKENGHIDKWTPADEPYQIAFFWGNDRYGTYKPPGHLNHITREFIDREWEGMDPAQRLSESARLFAALNAAMADAGVAAWDCKYKSEFDLWRPITGVQQADTDGNALTEADPTWEPLNHVDPDGVGPLAADPFSPNFPAYMSGHATFGAAHAAVMREYFGSDTFEPMAFSTDDPYVPGLKRTFDSWTDMALENGLSRIYLGVHWQIDADDGFAMGSALGEWLFDSRFRPIAECPADIDGNGTVNLDDIEAFVTAFLASDLFADVDGNGIVNLDDIGAFVTAFGAGCP